jgi:phosphoribosylanthranilate isomerase
VARVKICGVNSAEALNAAAEAGADWVGFVFFPGSPRYVTPAAAAALSGRLQGGPLRVGLFVEAPGVAPEGVAAGRKASGDRAIAEALAELRLDVLQVYAGPARIAEIAAKFRVPVWRCAGVASRGDLPDRVAPAAALLVEPRAALDAARPGGLGQALDWSLLRGWAPDYDWVLAGGLTPMNVAAAIAATGALAVDVSSGVESAPGVKSAAEIRKFVKAARG